MGHKSVNVSTVCALAAMLLLLHARVVPACMTCRTQWTSFQNNCYIFVSENKNFDDAEAHCQELSRHGRPSHLTSIKSGEEHDFLLELITATYDRRPDIWFGYRLNRTTGDFYWLDGSPLGDYTNWLPGEPNDANGREDCGTTVRDQAFKWNDIMCSYSLGFACKTAARFSNGSPSIP